MQEPQITPKNIIVIDEHTLAYMDEGDNYAIVLSGSKLRGATVPDMQMIMLSFRTTRPATIKDFDTFRVCADGYVKDSLFNFIKN